MKTILSCHQVDPMDDRANIAFAALPEYGKDVPAFDSIPQGMAVFNVHQALTDLMPRELIRLLQL